ncbi:MAG: hypothetical protein ABI912_08955 [Actinomycetota bacterium]
MTVHHLPERLVRAMSKRALVLSAITVEAFGVAVTASSLLEAVAFSLLLWIPLLLALALPGHFGTALGTLMALHALILGFALGNADSASVAIGWASALIAHVTVAFVCWMITYAVRWHTEG